jgi:hypothetical protein
MFLFLFFLHRYCTYSSDDPYVATPQIHVRNRNPFSVCFASSGQLTGARSSLLPITYRSSPGQHSTTDKTTDDGDVGDDDDDGPGVGMEPDASESDTRCRQQGWGGRRPNTHFTLVFPLAKDLLTSEAHQSRVYQSRKAEIRRPKLNHNC